MAKTPTKETTMEPEGVSVLANDDDIEEMVPLRLCRPEATAEAAGITPEKEEEFDDEFDCQHYHLYHSPNALSTKSTRSGRRLPLGHQVPEPSSSSSSSSSWCSIRDILGCFGFLLLLVVGLWNIKLATDMNSSFNDEALAPSAVMDNDEGGMVVVGTSTSKKNNPVSSSSSDDSSLLLLAQFRQRFGDIAYDLMLDYCQLVEDGRTQKTIDISPFVDLVNDIVDNIGVRGLYDEVFNVYGVTIALKDAFYRKGLTPSKINIVMFNGHQGPETRIKGRPCAGPKLDIIFWHKHWVGAVVADKLLRDGSLRISSEDDSQINDAPGYFQEMYRLTSSRPYPDIVPYHSVHGFWWQYVATVRPDLTEYPTDLFQSLCAPWLTEDDASEYSHNSMYRECRHGIGHAVFYAMHLRQIGATSLDVRYQNLPGSLDFSDEALCEGKRICNMAPKDDELCHDECWSGGFHHSMKLFRQTDDQGEAIFRGKQSCDGIHFN